MRNPGGYAQLFMPREGVVDFDRTTKEFVCEGTAELDTFTCKHCCAIVHVPAKADVNFVGFCRNCMKPICQPCSSKPCIPYEKQLEAIEKNAERAREYDRLLGRA